MTKNILLPAAKNGVPGCYVENFSIAGFSVVSTDGSFQASAGSEPPQTLSSGQSFGAESGNALGRVTFLNSGSVAINLTIGDFTASRPTTIQAAVGTFVGANSGGFDLGSAVHPEGISLPGVDSKGRERKIVYFTNTGKTQVGGADSNDCIGVYVPGNGFAAIMVFPGQTESLETNSDLLLAAISKDQTSVPMHLQIGIIEIFYSKPLQTDQ